MYYHGSKKLFKVFDKNRIGQNHAESEGSGFFFINKKQIAEVFAMSRQADGFVYEAELTFHNPLICKVYTDPEWTTVDVFDVRCADLVREAWQKRCDAIVIEGSHGDDMVVVFEPEQINLLKVYEGPDVVYDHRTPVETRYPDILGPDVVDPNVNVGAKPFLHDRDLVEGISDKVNSLEFDDLLDEASAVALMKSDQHHTADGKHFGRGDDFTKLAFALFCDGKQGDSAIRSCREDCLVIHDFVENITLVHDLRKTGASLGELARRSLVDVSGAMKVLLPDSPNAVVKTMSQVIGPAQEVQRLISKTPWYELPIMSFIHTDHDEVFRLGEDGQMPESMVNRMSNQASFTEQNAGENLHRPAYRG